MTTVKSTKHRNKQSSAAPKPIDPIDSPLERQFPPAKEIKISVAFFNRVLMNTNTWPKTIKFLKASLAEIDSEDIKRLINNRIIAAEAERDAHGL